MWFSNLGYPHSRLSFPYERYGPGSKKKLTFNSLEDIWNEIDIMVDAWRDNKFSLGRNLYFNLPQFCDPKWLITEKDSFIMREYMYMQDFKLPIADVLENADARTLDHFELIRNEVQEIKKYMSEENGK